MTTEPIWQALAGHHGESDALLLAQLIEEADAVVVGIGAGMSAADGFTYIGPRFTQAFPDFIEKYHWLDMLQASLFDFPSWSEYWAFQSRFIALNYLDQPVGQSYVVLKSILATKDYHIITTNADNAFAVAEYEMDKVFHIQGEYGLMQCSQHCHAQTYRDDALIREMIAQQQDLEIPYHLIPLCPVCGAPLEVNKRNAEKGMVEDADFMTQLARYQSFLAQHELDKVLYIEIGIGYTTPQFIKQPFQQRVRTNPRALMLTLNQKQYQVPADIATQVVPFKHHSAALLVATAQQIQKGRA